METFVNKKEIQNFKNYKRKLNDNKKISNYYKNFNNYKNVNNIYLSHGTSLNNACFISKVSKRAYYRACKELNKKSIVQQIKNTNYDKQYGGNKNILNDDEKYRLTEYHTETN